jgi:hypothetical protein
LKTQLNKKYKELESRLDEIRDKESDRPHRDVNNRYVSMTDPEAGIYGNGKAQICYKTHRVVEERSEVITAVEVTAGDLDEGQRLEALLKAHHTNTEIEAETIVADSKYGTIKNYLLCAEKNVNAHIPDLKAKKEKKLKNKIFPDTLFKYNSETDTYTCPGNKILKRKSYHAARSSIDYSARKKDCLTCELRSQCTRNKDGRTIKRHLEQSVINQMRDKAQSQQAKKDIRKRQHLMERTFACATRYGFDSARWRGLSRIAIQEYLVCCVQNIQKLIKEKPRIKIGEAVALKINEVKSHLEERLDQTYRYCQGKLSNFSGRFYIKVFD